MALTFNGVKPTKVIFNGTELTKIICDGVAVWTSFDPSILKDFNYIDNGDDTYTLTSWKGTYNGTSSTIFAVPDDSRVIL